MKAKFFATTPIGIEDVSAKEILRMLGCKVDVGVGKVFFESKIEEAVYSLNLMARTLHKVFIQLCKEKFVFLDDLYRFAKNIDYTWFIREEQSFAVRSERVGVHNFTSMDVSRVVGQAVIDSFLESCGKRLKVNLDEPDVEIYAFVKENDFLLGVNTTGESLHKRGYRVYEHPAALKSTLACGMLQISGWKQENSIIDPMCGGATIPIEAAFITRNMAPNRFRKNFAFLKLKIFEEKEFEEFRMKILENEKTGDSHIFGMEKFRRHLEGGIKNAEKAQVRDSILFKLGDATRKADYPDTDLDFIVVNPPYGVRMIPQGSPIKLYRSFLKTLKDVASGATLVLITAASRRFKKAATDANVEILEERKALHGQLRTTIFKCKI